MIRIQSNRIKKTIKTADNQNFSFEKHLDFHILNKEIFWIEKQVFSCRYFNVFGMIYNEIEEPVSASLVVVDFGRKLTKEEIKNNFFSISDLGYYYYLPNTKGLQLWEYEIFIPVGVETVKLGFRVWNNQNQIALFKNIKARESSSARFLQEEKQALIMKMSAQRNQLIEAQQKRSGHYAKLEYEQTRVKKLLKQVEYLEKDNLRMRNSLSLAVGTAIVQTKSIKDIIKLPLKIREALKNHKKKLLLNSTHSLKENKFNELPKSKISNTLIIESKQVLQHNAELNILGWPFPPSNGKINIMSIFDEFSRECFAPLANLIEPRPDNCIPLLNRDKPQLLFVESTWRGNKSTWQYRVAKYANPPGNELLSLVEEFQKNNLPTVFWNKEDPVHFDNFIHAAKEFDYIFTTAEEAIPKYRKVTKKAKIFALPFAAEAGLHNPIGSGKRNEKICFAGSYYANRFVERRDDQLMLLKAASNFDLDIYDRNAGANISKDFQFPEEFTPFIRGKLPYIEMNKAYRNYKIFLNVNSVIDSKTMFSRRVFELLACGTPIVSTVSAGIEEMFGNELVWMVKNEKEAKDALHTLLTSQQEWRRRSLQGIRAVFSKNTFAHRFEEVLRITGIAEQYLIRKKVLCLAEANTQEELDRLGEICTHQKLGSISKMLLVFTKNKKLVSRYSDVTIVQGVETWSSDIIKPEAKQFEATHIAFFDPKTIYGAFYLQDMLYAFDYSDAQIVGKPNILKDIYDYGQTIAPNSMIVDISHLDSCLLRVFSEKGVLEDAKNKGIRIFIPDSANFNMMAKFLPHAQYKNYLEKIEI